MQSPGERRFSPCPLCRGHDAEEVQEQRLALAGMGEFSVGFGHCRACGHIYQVRPVPERVLHEFYTLYSNYTCFDPEAARAAPATPLTRRLLALAEAHAPKHGTVFEVGCATGYHLAEFRRAGWKVGGCEVSPKACKQAAEIFGISLACGTEAECLPKQTGLSVALFSHVLEHLADPQAALRRARDALADDGVVVLEVPCAIEPALLPPGWFAFEHLHYFSETSLVRMLTSAGLTPLETRICFKAKGELYPVIAASAAKGRELTPVDPDPVAVSQSRQFLGEVVQRDEALWQNSSSRVGTLSGSVYVWGAGVHTARLFEKTPLLARADVLAIVDRDEQKWGQFQAEREIIGPDAFRARHRGEPIVISSYAAEPQIARSLEGLGVAQDRIVRLYT